MTDLDYTISGVRRDDLPSFRLIAFFEIFTSGRTRPQPGFGHEHW
jgi:hypothetical protein